MTKFSFPRPYAQLSTSQDQQNLINFVDTFMKVKYKTDLRVDEASFSDGNDERDRRRYQSSSRSVERTTEWRNESNPANYSEIKRELAAPSMTHHHSVTPPSRAQMIAESPSTSQDFQNDDIVSVNTEDAFALLDTPARSACDMMRDATPIRSSSPHRRATVPTDVTKTEAVHIQSLRKSRFDIQSDFFSLLSNSDFAEGRYFLEELDNCVRACDHLNRQLLHLFSHPDSFKRNTLRLGAQIQDLAGDDEAFAHSCFCTAEFKSKNAHRNLRKR
uniref:Uncharacterized protein n=1 Tax=Percolomonas cosmopolitus TaxID=63605 RepID=A0A7S1PK76_9EUKA